MMVREKYFHDFLEDAFEQGQYSTDDVIAFVLPLFEEVLTFHENGLVAPFGRKESLFITDNRLDIDETLAHKSSTNLPRLNELFADFKSEQFEILGKSRMETDVDEGTRKFENLHIHSDLSKAISHPAYVTGYNCFEILSGHHDEMSDIFCLGLILGSVSLGLDLYDEDDLRLFVYYRGNPAQYNQRIHPALASLITEMTELNRQKRARDLFDIINRLLNYREYDPEKQTDLSHTAGWVSKELKERHQYILNKLRNRLFDTSRRNRLLYYRSNLRFVNLTVSSVPMVLHYQSIRSELLFTWNAEISDKVKGMKEIALNKYLRFEEHAYLASAIDKVRVESQRDIQEYGFSQLKLVIAFLNWHNLRENQSERIQSPLLMVPVELKRTKRVKEDQCTMKVLDNHAEINPVLASQLRDLYGIKLPDFIDLEEMSPEQFYELLREQITSANQGIQLNLVSKPRIKLVHSVAKQTMSNYRRRLRNAGKGLASYKNMDYSYQPDNFKPLGLEIFKQKIETNASFLEFLINEDIQLSSHHLTEAKVKERKLFELAESESNPYSWDFDLCNIVLGNFNYKKMSLVRDYNQLIDGNIRQPVFESLFSDLPKEISSEENNSSSPEDWYHVITADPTQTAAIMRARKGVSYIIQGPPGTGKSQTITNLIADFVARGKSLLFVCEKRAALDVVYHRLKQNHLDELCCYIHDSQSDKREFIKNLKATYEDFVRNKIDLNAVKIQRSTLLQKMSQHLQQLQVFHSTAKLLPNEAGIKVRKLIDKVIELRPLILQQDVMQREAIPSYNHWQEFGERIKQLSTALEESGAEQAFGSHALSLVSEQVFTNESPVTYLNTQLSRSKELLDEINGILAGKQIAGEFLQSFGRLKKFCDVAAEILDFAEHNLMSLIDPASSASKELDNEIKQFRQLKQQSEESKSKNANWKNKFSEQDISGALEIAAKHENSFFKFLNGSWRRLKRQTEESYNFSAHQVRPAISKVLSLLREEYEAMSAESKMKNDLNNKYFTPNAEVFYVQVGFLRDRREEKELNALMAGASALSLISLGKKLNELEKSLRNCLHSHSEKALTELSDELDSISLNTHSLPALLPELRAFAALPEKLKNFLRQAHIDPSQAEALMADKTLEDVLRNNKLFATLDMHAIESSAREIQKCYKDLLQCNSQYIRASVRQKFARNIELSNTALSQLNNDQRHFKKQYNEGRKILENEFGKSMRYKSIRELSTKESGLVLRDIKPVWLMSPLSVSDSLPLDHNQFDVVIFDEASQITLEEGIPAVFRSPQAIIVGDDKQMPPTNFFTAKAEDPDDLELTADEDDDEALSADADSLLVQGSRKLPSAMLKWHYRSRYETLISYSNHAFYGADLLTIPDKTIHQDEKKTIEVTKPGQAAEFSGALYDRSISFHHLTQSVYEKRSNQDEADYIAKIVCELLKKRVKESIGIVAFSQEQQQTIEDALSSLAQSDKEFEQLLEEAYIRTEDDQFVGLIVKNLENIQGDERDIIILSVCYGFDSRKKMLMNFGPVNRKGGEKRLNVIFSRAKKHMAVISSIKYHHITNEYNEGANYFRRFLQYAENVSAGNMGAARQILNSLVINKAERSSEIVDSVVLKEMSARLGEKGYETCLQVGQSNFKCSLAVKKRKEDENYSLGILLDDDFHYANTDVMEQYFQRPAILKSFGWNIIQVFAKDWLQDSEKVMSQIMKRLADPEIKEEEAKPSSSPSIEERPLAVAEEVPSSKENITGVGEVEFETLYSGEGSSKNFWEIAVRLNKMVIRFGRLGSKGQTLLKTFENNAKANAEKEKLIREKVSKGYRKN
jgi:predicted DNA-binding WGR domain protein